MSTEFCGAAKVQNFSPAAPAGNKSKKQVAAIWQLAKTRKIDSDELHTLVHNVTGQDSIRLLSKAEADKVIVKLGGTPFNRIKGTPRRTVQYRRRSAGVQQIAQPAQLELMRSLAGARGMSDEGLESLTRRIIKCSQPRTTKEANKVIEALKAMNRRDIGVA